MTALQLSNGVRAALHLRQLRTRLGMTQRDLAKQMSKTQQTVARWETGAALLNVDQGRGSLLDFEVHNRTGARF
ncbi:MAG: helix-turn-helix transcriptional regulator [Mesorhizobium sp.]|uniref:helix-turn-helix transcriptional regulator n=1 Tax=Mesorhizobium sp. TaxID=1871066 RepID=UPI0012231A07|nr:MAG: helix-turn-helix transcriptional regulator [Mesorhizobium sp.]